MKARRNDALFLTNKFLSVALATTLAIYTASLKPVLLDYKREYPDAENLNKYNFIYWLLFIYYSFSALDQLIELYAVFYNREKGALGLLLEMNNFLGIAVVIYLTVFNYSDSAALPDKYSHLRNWVHFQVIYLYVVLGISVLMLLCFKVMQGRVVRKKIKNNKKNNQVKND